MTHSAPSSPRTAVILVDNKNRDLAVATLIAHHLQRFGVRAELQPIEAYQAVVGAFRPGIIVFNHLTASHLVDFSYRLKEMGVLCAVLPNEGISYDEDDLRFLAGRYHNKAHIDHFFVWNEPHRQALLECGYGAPTQIHCVGVPRFDFYFQPWSRLFSGPPPRAPRQRPQVLCCTNFVFSKFKGLPPEDAEKFFGVWRRMPKYSNPVELVDVQARYRERSMLFWQSLLATGRYDLILRPHPLENATFYQDWIKQLPAAQRERITLDPGSNITTLILNCDVEVSCETCTTALESWIARKPTVELALERHPLFFHPELGALTQLCDDPAKFPDAIDRVLRTPFSDEVMAGRERHLAKWCSSPEGRSAEKVAAIIRDALQGAPAFREDMLNFADTRRAWKLHGLNQVNRPCNFDPLLWAKQRLFPRKYALKASSSRKTIHPSDVLASQQRLQQAIKDPAEAPACACCR